jgi:hypothetical protein
MQVANKSKIPKIALEIVATIFIVIVSWYFVPSFWFWVLFEIAATVLVAIGCCGEWWLHHHPAGRKKQAKDEYHKLESRFIAMVSVGVMMELFAVGHSIRAGVILEGAVADAKQRVSSNEVQVAALEAKNLVLQSYVAEANKQAALANERVSSNELARVAMERELSAINFSLFPLSMKDERASALRLSKYAGMQVDLILATNNIDQLTGAILWHMMVMAKWEIVSVAQTNLSPGLISVWVNGPLTGTEKQDAVIMKTKEAVIALRDELRDSGTAVEGPRGSEVGVFVDKARPPLRIVIKVPPKSPPISAWEYWKNSEYLRTNETTVPKK